MSDVEVAISVNQHRLHVSFSRQIIVTVFQYHTRLTSLQVLIDIDYYKNRMQILALRPAPIQVSQLCHCV